VFNVPLVVALLVAFVITQVANLATTLYLHRCLSHRAMTMSAPLEFTMRAVLWATIGINRREWVAVHRKHHVFSDEPQDPHSPIQKGVWRVTFGNVVYYRREGKRAETLATYAKDLAPDRLDRLVFSHGMVGVGLGIALLVLLFGPATAAVVAVAHTVLYIMLSGCVNGLGHWYGRRPNDNKATNQRWLALLTAGEGMHNEHHEHPRSPYFGRSWWDLGGRAATLLSRAGLVRMHESPRPSHHRDSVPLAG
jgi:stearoyl-CoA desaturase (Delta-9 desaturase)